MTATSRSAPACCFRVERDGADPGGWLLPPERPPVESVVAHTVGEVGGVLAALDRAAAGDRFAAAFFAYESAPAFDPVLRTRPPAPGPLAACIVYDAPPRFAAALPAPAGGEAATDWTPDTDTAAHARAVDAIREHIAAGDTYQVNFTFRLRTAAPDDPWALFAARWNAHPVPHAAWLDAGGLAIASLSPELFFAVEGDRIVCRPMKGTAPRGRWTGEDDARRAALAASAKDRAENIMIVDMVRNDLGRIARTGSVRADPLCAIESYRSVFQMTSTVSARTDAPPSGILRALFPCASITGAPKVRSMDIIAALETSPRGVYCGAVGFVAPGRRMKFCVPIRTIVVDRGAGRAEYGVGGGIVWDSTAPAEFAEAFHKARVVMRPDPPFELLETMRVRRGRPPFLWREHLDRLARSAAYFGFPAPDGAALRSAIDEAGAAAAGRVLRVRLRYSAGGAITVEVQPLPGVRDRSPVRLALDDRPTDRSSKWLYHKTTRREVYAAALARHPGADDVLLWNEAGEIMETTVANVIVRLDDGWFTPPVESGLLPGTLRARLLQRGVVRERTIRREDLPRARRILLANSVRGLRDVQRAF